MPEIDSDFYLAKIDFRSCENINHIFEERHFAKKIQWGKLL